MDLSGKWVLPGLIDAHTHVGIGEQGMGREGMDVNETTDPVTPQVRAIDATNPDDGLCRRAGRGHHRDQRHAGQRQRDRRAGRGGQDVGSRIDQMVVRHPSGMKAAMGENPKRTHGDQKRMPCTRLGIAALLREHSCGRRTTSPSRPRRAGQAVRARPATGGDGHGAAPRDPDAHPRPPRRRHPDRAAHPRRVRLRHGAATTRPRRSRSPTS